MPGQFGKVCNKNPRIIVIIIIIIIILIALGTSFPKAKKLIKEIIML